MNYNLNQCEKYTYSYFGKLNNSCIDDNPDIINSVYRGILGAKDEEVFYKACVIGYAMGVKYYAVIIQLHNEREKNIKFEKDLSAKLIVKKYLNLSNNVFTDIDIDTYILLFNTEYLNKSNYDKSIVKYMDRFRNEIEALGYHMKIGIGSMTTSSSEHYLAIYDAQMTLKLMKRNEVTQAIGIINDFLLDEIFLSADKRSCSLYVGEKLSELKANDHDGILTDTIRVYCEQGFKKNETSKKLNIHRNTLEYRLRKIEKHLNFSSENYSNLIRLYIGILIENTYNR